MFLLFFAVNYSVLYYKVLILSPKRQEAVPSPRADPPASWRSLRSCRTDQVSSPPRHRNAVGSGRRSGWCPCRISRNPRGSPSGGRGGIGSPLGQTSGGSRCPASDGYRDRRNNKSARICGGGAMIRPGGSFVDRSCASRRGNRRSRSLNCYRIRPDSLQEKSSANEH